MILYAGRKSIVEAQAPLPNPRTPPADKPAQIRVEIAPRIADIGAQDWDACANPDPTTFNPFVSHGFLKALEDAGSVGGRCNHSQWHGTG